MTPQARHDGLLVQEVGDELVIYDQERDSIHSLNPSTALVRRHCDGQTSIAEMAALLAQELGLPADKELVWLALEQLEKAHLLMEPLQRTTEIVKFSRREMVRKLGHAGGVALLIPVIISINAPTPARAQYRAHECRCACNDGTETGFSIGTAQACSDACFNFCSGHGGGGGIFS